MLLILNSWYWLRAPCLCQLMTSGKSPTSLPGPPGAQVCNRELVLMMVSLQPRPGLQQIWVSTMPPMQRDAPLCLALMWIHSHPNPTSRGAPETDIMGQGRRSSRTMKDDVEHVHSPLFQVKCLWWRWNQSWQRLLAWKCCWEQGRTA